MFNVLLRRYVRHLRCSSAAASAIADRPDHRNGRRTPSRRRSSSLAPRCRSPSRSRRAVAPIAAARALTVSSHRRSARAAPSLPSHSPPSTASPQPEPATATHRSAIAAGRHCQRHPSHGEDPLPGHPRPNRRHPRPGHRRSPSPEHEHRRPS